MPRSPAYPRWLDRGMATLPSIQPPRVCRGSGGVAGAAHISGARQTPAEQATYGASMSSHVDVTGTGTASATPDVVTLDVRVTCEGLDVAGTLQTASARMGD